MGRHPSSAPGGEGRYQGLFEHMAEGYAYCRMVFEGDRPVDWIYLDVNEAFAELTGLREVEGKPVSEVVPDLLTTDPLLLERYGRVAATGRPERFETFVEGMGIWFDVSAYCPEPGCFVAVFSVITSRKNTELALAESQAALLLANADLERRVAERTADLSDLYDNAPCGYHSLDADGVFVRINDTELKWLGYSREELLGRLKVAELLTPSSVEVFARNFPAFKERGWLRDLELEMVRKDGSVLPVLLGATATYDEAGRFKASRSTMIDHTEGKRAEAALRESEQWFRSLSEAAFEAIVIHDRGVLINANDRYYEMFGYSPEELLGRQVMPLTIAAESLGRVAEEIERGGFGPYEAVGLKKNGDTFPMEIRVREIARAMGGARVAAIMDITERKAADAQREASFEAMRAARAELEAANIDLEAFAYSISHDLRSPLRAILGFSRIFSEEYEERLDPEGRRLLGIVGENALRMDRLITSLLSLSRATRSELQASRLDMAEMARSCYAELAAPESLERLEFAVAPMPGADGDAVLMRQVWINLLSNAIKYTRPRSKGRIEVGGYERDGERVYFVKDNGVGFDSARAGKLFGVFQRLHSTEEFEGSGLGLAIVQRIVLRHGGRAWGEGRVDGGASMYFSLPIAEAGTPLAR